MTSEKQPVVVEFISSDYPHKDAKHYFIGASLDDIMADTNKGKEFGFVKFSSHRQIDLTQVEKMSLGFYQDGYRAVQEGCKSYKLRTPTK